MNQYENDKHTPNAQTVAQIAKALNISPAFFYSADDQEAQLLRVFLRLKSYEREQVLALADD